MIRNHADGHAKGIPQNTLGIDDEKTTESDTHFFNEDTVLSRDLHVTVCQERQLELGTQAACLTSLVSPRKVGVLRISGHSKDLSVEFLELA